MLISSVLISPTGSNAKNTTVENSEDGFNASLQDIIKKTNTPILQKKLQQQKQMELGKSRISEVGVMQFAQEQQDVQRLMRALRTMQSEATGDVKDELGNIIKYFEENPPLNTDEMQQYMTKYVKDIPESANSHLKEGLLELIHQAGKLIGLFESIPDDKDDDDKKKRFSVQAEF